MAMEIPKSGYARFMKDGATSLKGVEEAVRRNIEATMELSSQIVSACGPNGEPPLFLIHLSSIAIIYTHLASSLMSLGNCRDE